MDKGKTDNLPLPNSNMSNAHAEIGAINQAHKAGLAKGADLKITVKGKDVCDYCKGDIAAAATAAGAKSVTITAFDQITGITRRYYWQPGMKSIKEVK
jgi:filamentous hemagglutinin